MRRIAILSLLVLAAQASAQELNYNYIEGGFRWAEVDTGIADVDGDGYGVGGSLEFGSNWHLFVDYETLDFDLGFDADQIEIGGGYHYRLMPGMDLIGNLKYVSVDGSGSGVDFDDDGFGAAIGLRALVAHNLEVAGYIDYQDIDDAGDELTIRGEGWLAFLPALAAGMYFETGDDTFGYGISLRWYYD